MPRNAKELEKGNKTNETNKKIVKKEPKKTPKKVASKTEKNKKSAEKKSTPKLAKNKEETIKSTVTKTKTKTQKSSEKKATSKKSTVKSLVSSATKTTTKRTISRKAVANKKKKIDIVEYYDLPYRYNQTIVKVLAQTPKTLFIYWDISDTDREKYKKQYGENFFETTKPILIVHNDTLGYSFEIEINDFANSWYLHVSDSKCDYRIELGRRPIVKTEKINTDYIYISTSNKIESPNDHILFNKEQKMVYFRNVKTGKQTQKPTISLSFIRNMGKIYNIYDFYKAIYPNENIEELYDLSNPSSGNPSSRKLFI